MDKKTRALARVDDFIARTVKGERLAPHVLERYGKRHGFTLGWCAKVNFPDGHRHELHILADGDFPYTAPRIAVADGPKVLTWPHLESDGLLCVLPPDTAVSGENPADVVEYVLGEACRLVEECIKGNTADDFRREFLSYWRLAADRAAMEFMSLVKPQRPGRRVFVWHGKSVRVVADDQETLNRWLLRWGAKEGKGQNYLFRDGVLIWLPEPLLPSEYPRKASEMRSLAWDRSPEAAAVLEELAASNADAIDVLLGAPTVNGACFAAVTVRPPTLVRGSGRKRDPLGAGFRPGHIPQDLFVNRYLSATAKVTKSTVQRADHSWIHGRDQDSRQERLRTRRVAVLGCGSVGGPLARLLAQSGVGSLLLVDCGRMDWPNVGRHALGATSVNCNKAQALANELERSYPHLRDVSWRDDRVGPAAKDLVEELVSCDLIVSTMGNWGAESFLNDIQRVRSSFPPILYGWVESNAAAAHAVLILQCGPCLRCGVDDKGRPCLAVTCWEDDQATFQEPACGALFTPYGPAELCWAHALLAEMVIDTLMKNWKSAIHRVWIGAESRIRDTGGTWSEQWIVEMGDPSPGGRTLEREWPAASDCTVCCGQVRVE